MSLRQAADSDANSRRQQRRESLHKDRQAGTATRGDKIGRRNHRLRILKACLSGFNSRPIQCGSDRRNTLDINTGSQCGVVSLPGW